MNKTCIIVTPYFPPSTLAGVHRARHLAKHLPSAGWHPIILCVDERYHEQRLDPDLAGLVPDATEIVKVSAIPAKYTRPFGVGEISIRGFCQLSKALFDLLKKRPIDVVLITGAPWYPMLLAPLLRKKYHVPVVLDFQDPWLSAVQMKESRLSKAWLSHVIGSFLQPIALRGASFITSVSDIQNQQLIERYPWLGPVNMAGLPIGADIDDFDHLDISGNSIADEVLEKNYINLAYVGTIWSSVMPTLRIFLQSLALLRDLAPELVVQLRVHFIGTSANPNDNTSYQVLPMAREEGVDQYLRELPRRIPYLQALSILRQSSGNIMLGSSERHYTASRVVPYLMAGRPYLSVYHADSHGHRILSKAGGGIALSFATHDELIALKNVIAASLHKLLTNAKSFQLPKPEAYANFEAGAVAQRYANIFQELLD